jgi:hypothetical protein
MNAQPAQPYAAAILALALALPNAAHAEVKAAGASGFLLEERVEIAASADEALHTLLDVGRWWNPQHTFSGRAENLSIDARPGGCWCERLEGGGFVRHMELAALLPGRAVRFTGALGPLLALGASGTLSFTVQPGAPGRVGVTATYAVSGFQPQGFVALAAAVDGVLAEQLTRYARLFERPSAGAVPP